MHIDSIIQVMKEVLTQNIEKLNSFREFVCFLKIVAILRECVQYFGGLLIIDSSFHCETSSLNSNLDKELTVKIHAFLFMILTFECEFIIQAHKIDSRCILA